VSQTGAYATVTFMTGERRVAWQLTVDGGIAMIWRGSRTVGWWLSKT
jgi:hypothetical protein